MKTKIEINGFEIEIEEVDGLITVKADKDGETVEEFSLESSDESQEDGEDVQSFKEFGDEEGDFEEGQEEMEEGQEEMEEGQEEMEEGQEEMEEEDSNESIKLKTFQSFINEAKK